MSETRRHALKMLGTIGVTCAFPFAGDELYGQHVHLATAQVPAAGPFTPAFFTSSEYATLSRLVDAIIPPTGTPGASGAGVPEYIDRVVSLNAEHQPLVRAGLAWLDEQSRARFSRPFLSLDDAGQVAILQPLSDEIDRRQRESQLQRYRAGAKGTMVYFVAVTDKDYPAPAAVRPSLAPGDDVPVRMFRLIKSLTADGYYTSRVGLLDELGYVGNTAQARFPACSVPEH
jgi:hypothetical protein